MAVQTFSSREFTRDIAAAKRAARGGPVFITDRGCPAFALLAIDDYYRIAGQGETTLLEVMDSIAGGDVLEFEPPRLNIQAQTVAFE